MLVAKELQWLCEYIELAKPHLPKRKKVSRIGKWDIGGRCGKKEQACIFTNDFRSYRIYFHTHRFPRCLEKPEPYSKIDILSLLAHELAHMLDMEHTPKHKKLESKILSMFMTRLASKGYISEEAELKELNQFATT
jgi:hypothetical protein